MILMMHILTPTMMTWTLVVMVMNTSFSDDDMDISDCDDDMTTGAVTGSEYDSEEEEFWFVFPLIGRWWHISNGITTRAHNILAF